MFVDDIPLENAYHALIIRSPAAKGALKSVSCPALPHAVRLITADDIPGTNSLFDANMPLLACGAVSYIGEPVAVLTGPELRVLEEYSGQCVIDIDEEPAEFSLKHAHETDALFHGETYETGVLAGTKAKTIIEGQYETGIQEHWYSAPHCAIARFHENTITITAASQYPDETRRSVAAVLGIAPGCVTFENSELGIHWDGYVWYPSVISALAALAAFLTQQTVKLQLTREEDYLFSPKRPPSIIRVESRLADNGQIIETAARVIIGLGAFGIQARKFLDEAARAFTQVYKTGKLTVDVRAVKTNTPPAGPFAGFGSSIASFALERHISKITDFLNEDGTSWRNTHLLRKLKGRFEDGGPKNAVSHHHDLIHAVSEASGFQRKWAAYELFRQRPADYNERVLEPRGIGAAFALAGECQPGTADELYHKTPAAACVVEVKIDRVNYDAKIRGIWFYVAAAKPEDTSRARIILRRAAIAALGWASTEKIKCVHGTITPPFCVLYQLLPASEHPPVHLSFIEEDAAPCAESKLEELSFSAIPAAYTQAVSQAANYHFERIPIIGQDVWYVLNMERNEPPPSKREAAPLTGGGDEA